MTKKVLSVLLVVCMMATLFAGAAWAEAETYTITATAGTNGSISPASVTVNSGDNTTFTITPNDGYKIESLKVDDTDETVASSYTFTNVTASHTIAATFAAKTSYEIEKIAGDNGTISGATTVYEGENADVVVTPASGYQISSLTDNGNAVSAAVGKTSAYTYTITNASAKHTVVASFEAKAVTLTSIEITANPTKTVYSTGETINLSGLVVKATYSNSTTNSYAYSSYPSRFTWTPTTATWTGIDTVTVTYTDSYGSGKGSFNINVSAPSYTYNVTSSYTGSGTISRSGSYVSYSGSTYYYNSTASTYSFSPATGYTLSAVYIDDTYNSSATSYGTYTFPASTTGSHTVRAEFTYNSGTYTISTRTYTDDYSGSAGGSLTTNRSTVSYGGSYTYYAYPNDGYSLSYVSVNNAGSTTKYYTKSNTITAYGNQVVTAYFTSDSGSYTITTREYTNGSQSTAGGTLTTSRSSVNYNGTYTYYAEARSGYALSYVTVNNGGTSTDYTDASRTITAKGKQTIYAYFVSDNGDYSITTRVYTDDVQSSTGGTLSLTRSSVDRGESYTYTATAKSGYTLDHVTVVNAGTSTDYTSTSRTITAGAGAQKVYAYFVSNSGDYKIVSNVYTSGASSITGGTLTTSGVSASTSGTKYCNYGTSVVYTITPNSGYYLSELLVDNSSVETNKLTSFTYTFSNVKSNHTIKAYFLPTNNISSIVVKTLPAKTSYTVGDTLDTTGLVLTAIRSDGTTTNVTSGFTCTPTVLNAVGTQAITVTYNSKTTSFNVTVAAKSTTTYTDVASTKWYYSYVMDLSNKGYVSGNYNASTKTYYFRPEGNITRAEFIKILANVSGAGMSSYTTSSFKDVGTSYWAYKEIEWAYRNSIVTGTSSGYFSPAANITRQDMCVMLERFAQYQKKTLTATTGAVTFTDAASIASYAKEPVAEMQKAGIISGIKDGSGYKFAPLGNATRAEACTIISKYLK